VPSLYLALVFCEFCLFKKQFLSLRCSSLRAGGSLLATRDLTGYDVDVAALVLTQQLGLNITWVVSATFAGVRAALRAGQCDIALGAMDAYPLVGSCVACAPLPSNLSRFHLNEPSSDYTSAVPLLPAGCCLDMSTPYFYTGFALLSQSMPLTSYFQLFLGALLSSATLYVYLVLVLATVAAAYVIYGLEWMSNHRREATFHDLLTSLYWSVATLSTAGYGDVFPVSNAARAFTICYLLLVIALLACLSGQVSSALTTTSLQAAKSITSLSQVTQKLCVERPFYSLYDWLVGLPDSSKPPSSRITYALPSVCLQGVLNGTFQASLTERMGQTFYARTFGNEQTSISPIISDGIGYVWLFATNSPYRSFLNTALLEARFSKTWAPLYAQLLAQWGSAPSPSPLSDSEDQIPLELVIPIAVLIGIACLHHAHVHGHFPRASEPLRRLTRRASCGQQPGLAPPLLQLRSQLEEGIACLASAREALQRLESSGAVRLMEGEGAPLEKSPNGRGVQRSPSSPRIPAVDL